MLNIEIIPCLSDNYSYILHDDATETIGVVDPSEFKPIDDFISKKFKKIDVLVNNVLDGKRGKFLKYNISSLNKEFWGTFGSTMLLTEKILPIMRKNRYGKIINIGSIWGIQAPKFKT